MTTKAMTSNMEMTTLRSCKKLSAYKNAKAMSNQQQEQLQQQNKDLINGNKNPYNNNLTNDNNNSGNGTDIFSNEAFMKSFNHACAASLLQQQQQITNEDSSQRCYEYAVPMDSPNSNASSLQSAVSISYGSIIEEPPLTPPATPAFSLNVPASTYNKSITTATTTSATTTSANPGQHPHSSLLLRQLSNNTNAANTAGNLLLNETSLPNNEYTGISSPYTVSSNGGGIEFLEFSSLEYDGQYSNMSAMGNNNNTRYSQHCHNHTNDINYHPQAAYVGYNEAGEPLSLSAINFMPNSELKASNFSAISANDEIDPKEIDQYLMEQVLPMANNQMQLTSVSTSNSSKATKVTMATRMKLCSSSSSTSSSTSPSTCSSTSASMSSPIYKQVVSSDMLHELQPVDNRKTPSITTSATSETSAATTTKPTTIIPKNVLSAMHHHNSHNIIAEKDSADFVSLTHPAIVANDGNYSFYSYYGNDAVASSLSPSTGFPQYLQHQSQAHIHEPSTQHLCIQEQQQQQQQQHTQQHQIWEHYVSP